MFDLGQFPRTYLATTPTPLEPMPRLARALGGPHIYVKRDDCTGLATGGNKTRKLEFLMADAARAGADIVVTQGAVQSNHVRQTAAAAAKLGFACHALLEERLAEEPADYAQSGNVFLDELLGATLERRPAGSDMPGELEQTAERLRQDGWRPYVIPGGGSNSVGALGYVDCLQETMGQARQAGIAVDHIVHGSGSAGTQAGLLAGAQLLDAAPQITGISVRFDTATQEAKVHSLAQDVTDRLGSAPVPRAQVVAHDGYVGRGYGYPTDGMVEAVEMCARKEGLLLDPVYSGKGMAGLIDLIRQGRFARDETVVFLHTGGAVSLFAYTWAFAPTGNTGSPP